MAADVRERQSLSFSPPGSTAERTKGGRNPLKEDITDTAFYVPLVLNGPNAPQQVILAGIPAKSDLFLSRMKQNCAIYSLCKRLL
jgi:hypothetical protein